MTKVDRIALFADWRQDAACRGMDPDDFHPNHRDGQRMILQARAAKAICATCPVREPCLETAMALPKDEALGIWGGTGPSERKAIRAARRLLRAS